jgi:hypothetical protein
MECTSFAIPSKSNQIAIFLFWKYMYLQSGNPVHYVRPTYLHMTRGKGKPRKPVKPFLRFDAKMWKPNLLGSCEVNVLWRNEDWADEAFSARFERWACKPKSYLYLHARLHSGFCAKKFNQLNNLKPSLASFSSFISAFRLQRSLHWNE